MTINEFLKLPLLKLPQDRPQENEFYQYILSVLNNYMIELNQVDIFFIEGKENYYSTNNKEFVIGIASTLKNTIIKCLQQYFNGNTYQAYDIFKKGLDKELEKIKFAIYTLNQDEKLFRVRKADKNYLEPKEIFHIPMNKRELISSQRFSISGYPCLYFSNSTYLCWLELNQPDLNKCHVASYCANSQSDFKLLDLTNKHPSFLKKIQNENVNLGKELIRYLSLWPLIFATSIKVKYRDKDFKPEYIIPQFLMQYVKNSYSKDKVNKLNGIKYSSTHYDLYSSKNDFYNIAIPIFTSTKEPYCKIMTESFKFTRPVSWNYLNLINEELKKYVDNCLGIDIDDREETQICIIPGIFDDYNFTKFGIMEKFIKDISLININECGELKDDSSNI